MPRHVPQLCREAHSSQGRCQHLCTTGKMHHLPGWQREEGVSPTQRRDANGFVGSSSRGKQDPCDRQDLCSGICLLPVPLPPLTAGQGGLLPAVWKPTPCVPVLCAKPRLRHSPRARGAAKGSGQGARGCLSCLLDRQKLEEDL